MNETFETLEERQLRMFAEARQQSIELLQQLTELQNQLLETEYERDCALMELKSMQEDLTQEVFKERVRNRTKSLPFPMLNFREDYGTKPK